jgi:hypothetical protein
MSRISMWKNIFGHREKVAVEVDGKIELLTDTQSFRFSEISEMRDISSRQSYRNPLEDTCYRLEDAAFRLMVSEDEVLEKAAGGDLHLYVNAAGMPGRWRRRDQEGNVSQSVVATVRSGMLMLRSKACADLSKHGRAIVRALDLGRSNELSQAGIDENTLANLRAWGPGEKQFFPLHPLRVERDMVVLLP